MCICLWVHVCPHSSTSKRQRGSSMFSVCIGQRIPSPLLQEHVCTNTYMYSINYALRHDSSSHRCLIERPGICQWDLHTLPANGDHRCLKALLFKVNVRRAAYANSNQQSSTIILWAINYRWITDKIHVPLTWTFAPLVCTVHLVVVGSTGTRHVLFQYGFMIFSQLLDLIKGFIGQLLVYSKQQ